MDFGWLKRIFKKKNLSNTNTGELATIDTSFIRVPKLSKLSKEEKEKVLDFYNKLISDDDINLVKYSNDLLEKANTEREMLLRAMSRYEEQYRFLEEKYKKEKQVPSIEIYHLGKLSSLEYAIIEKNIINIRRELELKLVALDMYIKKEEKRKYDLLGIFGKAERIRYLTDKNKLLSERERLLTSVKIDENILTIIRKDIKDNQRLVLFHDLLYRLQKSDVTSSLRDSLGDSMYRLSEKSFYTIKKEYEDEVETEVGYKMKGYNLREELFDVSCLEYKYEFLKKSRRGVIWGDELIKYVFDEARHYGEDCSWKDFLLIVPDEFLDKLYGIIAKYSHKRDLYVYEHRNDYKEYLQDMKELINKYETTSKEEWDLDLLKEKIIYYTDKLRQYLNIYGNNRSSYFNESYDEQISPPMEEQLRRNYFRLLFLYTIRNGLDKLVYEMSSHSCYYVGFYLTIEQLYVEFLFIINELSTDVYNKYKVIPNFNIKCDDYDYNELNDKIKHIIEVGDFLYKVLNGYYDKQEIYIDDNGPHEYHFNCDNVRLVSYLKNNIINKKIYNIGLDETFSIDDLYYLCNMTGIDKYKLFNLNPFIDLITKIEWARLDNEIDERIYVIPHQIRFKQGMELDSLVESINKSLLADILNINENNIAIYLTNWSQVISITELLKNEKSNVKYLMMSDDLYKSYKDAFGYDLMQKIIKVPNHTRYNALSSYLDQELAKEQEQHKVLSKTL